MTDPRRSPLERVAGRLGMTTWSVALVGWLGAATAGVTALAVLATTGTLPGSGAWYGAPAPTVVPHATERQPDAPSAVAQPAPVPGPDRTSRPVVMVPVAEAPPVPAVAPVVVRLPRVVVALPVDEGGLEAPVIYENLPVVQGASTRVSVGVDGSKTPTVLVEKGLPVGSSASGSPTGSAAGKTTTVGTEPVTTLTGTADPSLVGKVVSSTAPAASTDTLATAASTRVPTVVGGTQVANRQASPTPALPGDVVVDAPTEAG